MATSSGQSTPSSFDVDDRINSEAALRAAFLDALGDAVIATDPEGHVIYWNDAATRLYGWRADEVIGSPVLDVTPAIGLGPEPAAIMERLRAGESWTGDLMLRHRDGHSVPAHVTNTAVTDGDGRVIALVGISRDISRGREAGAGAAASAQRLDPGEPPSSAVLWEWDIDTDAIRWTGPTADVFGYAAGDVESTWEWWTSRIHPEDRARVADGFRRLVDGEAPFWTDEYRFLTRDRGYATVFDRAYVSRDGSGRALRVSGTAIDVTERRRQHEGQRFLAQTSMILDLSLDYEATIPTIARLTVHAIADYCILHVAAGDGFPDLDTAAHIDPRLQATVEEAAGFLAAGPPSGSITDRVVRDGHSVLVADVASEAPEDLVGNPGLLDAAARLAPRSVMVVPLRARRAVTGFALFARSTDDRPYVDDDLRLAEELGRRIGLAIDHSRLFQSAELANRAKADFLAVISHELRTPLTAVLGYADLLAEEIGGSLNEVQHRQVDRIRAGSDRLLRLIEGILTFARLEAGGEKPQMEAVPLAGLIERAEELVAPRAAEKGVGFRTVLEDVPETIRTDADKFVQVLLSLLTNAVKFTHEGAVRLRAHRGDGLLLLDVIDSGSGIAAEHLPYVFNPFWQAEQPATRRAGGAGLGLSVARRLARLLNGDVVVAESSPQGTTFRFQLPLRPGA